MKPEFELLQVVALAHDVPEHGLRAGDAGTIVESLQGGSLWIVEFVETSGGTRALLTLSSDDIRAIPTGSVLSVREPQAPYG